MVVRAAHAFVDHLGEAHARFPAHVHADAGEHRDDARVLADRSMTLRAHARVHQDLPDRVLRGRARFALVGAGHGLDEIRRVVIRNVLKRVGDALDHVVLADRSHGEFEAWAEAGGKSITAAARAAGTRIRPAVARSAALPTSLLRDTR